MRLQQNIIYNDTFLAGGPAELKEFLMSAADHLLRGCHNF